MNKLEFGDKLRERLATLEIGDMEVVSIPDVGNLVRFRVKLPDGGVKYGSFKFNQLDDALLDEITKVVNARAGEP